MRNLFLLASLAACSPNQGPEDTGAEDGPESEVFEVFEVFDGDVASIELAPWSVWRAEACDEGVCADITNRVILVDGFLCGPPDFEGYDYAREMDVPDGCLVKAESFDLTITLTAE